LGKGCSPGAEHINAETQRSAEVAERVAFRRIPAQSQKKHTVPSKGFRSGPYPASCLSLALKSGRYDEKSRLDDWRNEINWAEKLLLYVHGPAYNPQHVMELNEADPRVSDARVFNWGSIRALCPEVSGRRWTKAAMDEANAYKVFEMP
jgi:hypothetical protein